MAFMRPSRITGKLNRGEPALATTLHLTDPSVYELTSLLGFDGIWMDLEHHVTSVETASGLIRAARAGGDADVIARPAKGEFMRMGRLLEAGASGIMYPRCDDADEAAEVVRWAKFAPLGQRGLDAANPDNAYCSLPIDEYVRWANKNTFVIIQIEEPSAIQHARAIAEVEGVDLLMLGPADMSVLAGIPGQTDHPIVTEARMEVAEAATAAGKSWAVTCGTVDQAREMIDGGASLVFYHADILMIRQALEQMRQEFEQLGFAFDRSHHAPRDEAAPRGA
jgi:4-hydroxy-2-oxoheptanedioate aldolase